ILVPGLDGAAGAGLHDHYLPVAAGVHHGRAARSGDSSGDKRPLWQFRPGP
ncbi:unnamed protein product, partial [Symbiodinium necroappetens]